MAERSIYWLLFLFLSMGIIMLSARYIEGHTLFCPTKAIEFLPTMAGLDFEDVFFKSPDGLRLNGWFIPGPKARYTVLFCHGNAGNISHRLERIKFFNRLGCNMLIFDYRGYGKSEGAPSERGLYDDAGSAYAYLLSRGIPADTIISYGESLGGAVSVDLASRHPIAALILDSTFSSAKDMARRILPFIPYWIFASRFDSTGKIRAIRVPKLIIHSLNDEIVPYEFSRALYEASAPPKEFLQVNGGHNSCFYECETLYQEKISDFLRRLPAGGRAPIHPIESGA
jgi:hypothetical protein